MQLKAGAKNLYNPPPLFRSLMKIVVNVWDHTNGTLENEQMEAFPNIPILYSKFSLLYLK